MLEVFSLVLFAHVVAAAALVGHSLGAPITRALVREAETVADLRKVVAFETRLSRWNPVIALVLLASGIYLGSVGFWYQGWFYLAIAGWVVNGALAKRVIVPWAAALMAATASATGRVPATLDVLRRSKKVVVAAQVMLANDLALLFIMLTKPATLEAAAVFGGFNAALVALALVPRRAASPVLSEASS